MTASDLTAVSRDDDRVNAIRQRLEAATPGPWAATCMGSEGYHVHEAEASEGIRRKRTALCTYEKWEVDKANADLIAAAPADLGWLLAERDRLHRQVEEQAAKIEAVRAFVADDDEDGWSALIPANLLRAALSSAAVPEPTEN